MTLSYHIEKIQQVENVGTWFSIILWKNLKIKLVRPLRNLQKQKFSFKCIFTATQIDWVGGSVGRVQDAQFAKCGHGFESKKKGFWKIFFFIIGERGWAHTKVFRLPHPLMTKCLAANIVSKHHEKYIDPETLYVVWILLAPTRFAQQKVSCISSYGGAI